MCVCIYIYIQNFKDNFKSCKLSSTTVIQTNTKIDEEFDLESWTHVDSSLNFSMTLKKESNHVCHRFMFSEYIAINTIFFQNGINISFFEDNWEI